MKLPGVPFGTTTVGGLIEWLRQFVASVAAGWGVEHTAIGLHDWHWTDIPYDANRFSTGATMTWTVDSADQHTYRCGRLGTLMVVTFRVQNTDCSGGSTELRVALPDGYTVSGDWTGALRYVDAGTTDTGHCRASSGTRYIACFTRQGGNWTLTTSDNTTVFGSITLQVTKD